MEKIMSMDQVQLLLEQSPVGATFAALTSLLLLSAVANFIVKRLLLRIIRRLLRMTPYGNDPEIMRHDVIARLANIVPALVIIIGIPLVPKMPEAVATIVQNVAVAFIILALAMTASAAINIASTLYHRRAEAANRPIKGYFQLVKIALFAVSAILIVAALIDKSPLILLSGLGAMAAVLMLVFQDTLLSFVASLQLSSGDMVRVGDWIEMPQLNADGDVIDIALHTVKVQNWDRTITTIPTRRLISDPFKNWRGMHESGGRRIKRAIHIDQTSIRFLTDEERAQLKRFRLLAPYLEEKEAELSAWNGNLGDTARIAVNTRRLTNVGTFRNYVMRYLQNHEHIHNGMIQLVRQLSPGPTGLPIEIYCFTSTTAWGLYEGIQSDIFDHLYAILPEFGLRAYQQPSGADVLAVGQFLPRG